jgi:hypothetical protein
MQEEMQLGHFESVDDLLTQALHALREKTVTQVSTQPARRLIDILTSAPFAGSELDIQRPKDYPRTVEL